MHRANQGDPAICQEQRDTILTKALLRLAETYEIKGKDLAQIIGISESSVSRLMQKHGLIPEHKKEGELALLLIRLYRSLSALVGDDPEKAKLWLSSSNEYFSESPPIERIKSIEGLLEVVNYLDAMRGKI